MANEFKFAFFKRTIQHLTIGYNKGNVLSKVTKSAMNIIGAKIRQIHNSLETIVTSFEEIRATSASTSTNASNINKNMNNIIESTSRINTDIHNNVKEISKATEESQKIQALFTELHERTDQVKEMTREIDDVAQQTNILAINASIEAARAGNAGKGFQIIAKEIRGLSQQTQDFATNIEGTINGFNTGVMQVRDSFNRLLVLLENFQQDLISTSETFDHNNKSLMGSGQIIAEIRAGIDEQTDAITEGLKSLEDVYALLKDADTISSTLNNTHSALDNLLNKKS
ncbi:MAG: methyl-accepting chemotaxis protein [Spirochaetales bacterium]|uniref:Methyl-accepting chemotaxis protein n=1 Tax=Candidatus Thalassospirochaeta sargassi TaxID=3119039 RepID=A0AAJ1ID60_9SPIO|nr:methyl-accepting chemotaxis protein [Spirochaetales bacterium]